MQMTETADEKQVYICSILSIDMYDDALYSWTLSVHNNLSFNGINQILI